MKISYIVEIYFATKRPYFDLTEGWLEKRIKLFKSLTLKSLLDQVFNDFRIWLYCDPEFKKFLERHKWHSKVELLYDFGKSMLEEIDSEFLSITRTDSDDLFHKAAMADVSRGIRFRPQRDCMIFRKILLWDVKNNFLGTLYMEGNPFFTHVFPKRIYKNWRNYSEQHLLPFGKSGAKSGEANVLRANRACIVRHDLNYTNVTKSDALRNRKPMDIYLALGLGEVLPLTTDAEQILSILKDFGVRRSYRVLRKNDETPKKKEQSRDKRAE